MAGVSIVTHAKLADELMRELYSPKPDKERIKMLRERLRAQRPQNQTEGEP